MSLDDNHTYTMVGDNKGWLYSVTDAPHQPSPEFSLPTAVCVLAIHRRRINAYSSIRSLLLAHRDICVSPQPSGHHAKSWSTTPPPPSESLLDLILMRYSRSYMAPTFKNFYPESRSQVGVRRLDFTFSRSKLGPG